jgi:hypothetical protein
MAEEPYTSRLLGEVAKINQPSVQWHLAQMLSEIELTPEQRQKAITLLKNHLQSLEVDWIVASCSIDTLVLFVQNGDMPVKELITLLKLQKNHHSKALVKRVNKQLDNLQT